MKTKIGVLSDTHLRRVTDDIKAIYDRYLSDVDIILHAGDYVSYDVVTFLDTGNFHGVSGNMDTVEVKETLPWKKVIEVGSHRIGLIHGWGSSVGLEERIQTEFHGVDIIVYGHSHKAVSHVRDGVLLFNPGTAIGYSSSAEHTLGILELGEGADSKIISF